MYCSQISQHKDATKRKQNTVKSKKENNKSEICAGRSIIYSAKKRPMKNQQRAYTYVCVCVTCVSVYKYVHDMSAFTHENVFLLIIGKFFSGCPFRLLDKAGDKSPQLVSCNILLFLAYHILELLYASFTRYTKIFFICYFFYLYSTF